MRLLAALAVLACAPLTTLAQTEPPPEAVAAPAARRADWSFGAGLSSGAFFTSGTVFSIGPSGSTIMSTTRTSIPFATASLERRLSGETWLAIGFAGAFSRQRQDVPTDSFGLTHEDAQQLYVTAGLRQVLTGRAAPVDVSLLVLAKGGSVQSDQRWMQAGPETARTVSGWLAGAELGIAVDRELTPGLSLRIATPLVAATYTEGRVEAPGEPPHTGTDASVTVLLDPRIELRLAF